MGAAVSIAAHLPCPPCPPCLAQGRTCHFGPGRGPQGEAALRRTRQEPLAPSRRNGDEEETSEIRVLAFKSELPERGEPHSQLASVAAAKPAQNVGLLRTHRQPWHTHRKAPLSPGRAPISIDFLAPEGRCRPGAASSPLLRLGSAARHAPRWGAASALAHCRCPRQVEARALTSFGRVPLGCASEPPASG